MSRKSVLSMRVSVSAESEFPLRGYFVSVGGALLLLLFAADVIMPAPDRLAESHSSLPPIRIHTDLKRPEAVFIDTNQFEPRPVP